MENKPISEIRRLTPAEAQVYLADHNFHLQRAVRSQHASAIASAMKSGDFPPGTALYFAKTPEKLELTNGQHRLRAQILADMEIDYTIITITCANANQVSSLCTQFDIGAKRSMADRMKALNLAAHIALPNKYAQLLSTGAPYLKYRFNKFSSKQSGAMSPLQRLEIIKEFEKGSIQFFDCMGSSEKWITKVFMRPNFVALGAYLFQFAPNKAAELWGAMAINNFSGLDDPRKHMFELAQNADTASIAMTRSIVITQAFIRGWNIFVQDKTLDTKLKPAPLPSDNIKILGVNDPGWISIPPVKIEPAKSRTEVVADVMQQLSMLYPKAEIDARS